MDERKPSHVPRRRRWTLNPTIGFKVGTGSSIREAGALVVLFATVVSAVIALSPSGRWLFGAPHWDRWLAAIASGLVAVVSALLVVANYERILGVRVEVSLLIDNATNRAAQDTLGPLEAKLLRPRTPAIAMTVVIAAVAVAPVPAAGVIVAIPFVTWLSAVLPQSMAYTWRRSESFFTVPQGPARDSVLTTVALSSVFAMSTLVIAWRLSNLDTLSVHAADRLVLAVVCVVVVGFLTQPFLALVLYDAEEPKVRRIRWLLTYFNVAALVAVGAAFSPRLASFWRDTIVAFLQSAALALFVVPPVVATRSLFRPPSSPSQESPSTAIQQTTPMSSSVIGSRGGAAGTG